jgi:hypothetical protein
MLAMHLNKDVHKALDEKKINQSVAEVIGTLPEGSQTPFLLYILENNITNREDAYKALRRYLNNTLYTIGYEGKEIQQKSLCQHWQTLFYIPSAMKAKKSSSS